MNSATWSDQLDLLIRSRTPLIWIRSSQRKVVLKPCCMRRPNGCNAVWPAGISSKDLSGVLNAKGLGSRQPMAVLQWLQQLESSSPTVLLVKDFHRFCDDPGIARMLRNLSTSLRSTTHTLVLCSGSWTPPRSRGGSDPSGSAVAGWNDLRQLIKSISSSSGAPLEPPSSMNSPGLQRSE